jgi:hypothetical protein
MSHEPAETPVHDPLAALERKLIDEYVRARGYDPDRLEELGDELRNALLKDASIYASSRLAEVEARSQFVHDIHGGPDVSRSRAE